MSTPLPKQGSAPAPDNEVELQSQPMDLANKTSTIITAGSGTIVPSRVIGDGAKSIFLQVKPAGSPVPTITASGISLPVSGAPSISASAVIQATPVAAPVTIPMGKFQTSIRPGATVTLAPRTIGSAIVTTTGPYTTQSSHVPKGAAAVASISIPRSAVASSAVIRPAPSTSPAISQVTGFAVANRAVRPSSVSVRPGTLDVAGGSGSTANISGTWVTVTPATAVVQPPPIPTLYKATANTVANTAIKSAANVMVAAGHKPTPVLTPSPSASSISIIGPPKVAVTNTASNITLYSVRGTPSQPIVTSRGPANQSAAVTVGPRLVSATEVIKSTSTLLHTAAQRTPSMTITSTSSVQGVEKHFVKTVPGTGTPTLVGSGVSIQGTSSQTRPTSAATVQIASRTVPQITAVPLSTAASLIPSNSGGTPVVLASGLKNVTPISNVATVTKGGQQNTSVQFPQMSAPAAGNKPGSNPSPIVAVTRPVTSSVPVGSGTVPGSSRTYLVANPVPPSAVIPVAKVLPQPVASAASAIRNVSAASINLSGASSVNETSHSAVTTGTGPPIQVASRSSSAIVEGGGNPIPHPAAAQPNTPSKLIGTSPRPSILRKRDFEGVPLKAQKNLTTTLALMTSTTSTPSTNSATTSVSSTPAISPPSPRRLDLGLTPGGPNGDSSRSSSGGSTTLSASSSPGIPPDLDESNPPTSVATAIAPSVLGNVLSSIKIKQEAQDNVETSGPISSLIKIAAASTPHLHAAPVEVQMSPRKKPRKQQLLGQELQEVRSSDDELQQPAVLVKETKIEPVIKVEPKEAVVKRPRVSLISSYKQSWKPRNHHFTRYSDVKLKDDRRPTVTDLANQKQIMQKVHGWKVFHLTAQIEEMAHSESQVHERLSTVLEVMEKLGAGKSSDRDLLRVNELIKGNLQRSKVIQDGLEDSKVQVQKIFDHKPRAEEIIQRYMYKRLAKKREKL